MSAKSIFGEIKRSVSTLQVNSNKNFRVFNGTDNVALEKEIRKDLKMGDIYPLRICGRDLISVWFESSSLLLHGRVGLRSV